VNRGEGTAEEAVPLPVFPLIQGNMGIVKLSVGLDRMAKEKILIVEDEEDIRELVVHNLNSEGYTARGVATGEEGLEEVRKVPPDLIVLDLMLPGISGLDVCRLLKTDSDTEQIPILMLTAKSGEADIVAGLEVGADDYVTKPFSPRVLVARIRTVLRRKSDINLKDSDCIKVGDIAIHLGRYEVLVRDERVDLTPTEFRILNFMARRPGWVYTRNQIIDGIGDGSVIVTDRAVDVQIVSLRRKLGPCGSYIETVRGVGYRLRQ
jgi:two-component system phosphate regulon response regulator PhoB